MPTTIYRAFDGMIFESYSECAEYEQIHISRQELIDKCNSASFNNLDMFNTYPKDQHPSMSISDLGFFIAENREVLLGLLQESNNKKPEGIVQFGPVKGKIISIAKIEDQGAFGEDACRNCVSNNKYVMQEIFGRQLNTDGCYDGERACQLLDKSFQASCAEEGVHYELVD